MKLRPVETGITPAVTTIFSGFTVSDIIDAIVEKKVAAVCGWIDTVGVRPEQTLIVGSYLTGARLANRLVERSSVTVVDIYPHLRHLLDRRVSFHTTLAGLEAAGWDLIVDTTGLGGVSPEEILRLNTPEAFLVEDPCSDGSDRTIRKTSRSSLILGLIPAPEKGALYTAGLGARTSGTMTLTMAVLFCSMRDTLQEEGVLYSTAAMEFYERVLFQEKDPGRFRELLDRPALAVSTLSGIDCDGIIAGNLALIRSQVEEWWCNPNESF